MDIPFELDKVHCGDCVDMLKLLPDNSVDSVVTDPPAGIAFMGKEWDKDKGGRDEWVKWLGEIFGEVKRVIKPGGHLLVWALPRTSHWTAWALEGAGLEIRDCVYFCFGTGFPKSLSIGKAVDKMQGVESKIIGQSDKGSGAQRNKLDNHGKGDTGIGYMDGSGKVFDITVPVSEDGKKWEGWGTALKPAVECWWLCRKPLGEKTVVQNVLKWGTGAINIDGCRVPTEDVVGASGRWGMKEKKGWNKNSIKSETTNVYEHTKGRFPSHLIHDGSDEVVGLFPQTAKSTFKNGVARKRKGYKVAERYGIANSPDSYGDSGSAARFFYCSKASKADRDEGLEDCETSSKNHHPTVKSVNLMKYLRRLITPMGGIILDPFAGSGSTLKAAKIEGFRGLGFEREEEYVKIANKRIGAVSKGMICEEIGNVEEKVCCDEKKEEKQSELSFE